jgi:hypothetical protein
LLALLRHYITSAAIPAMPVEPGDKEVGS